MQLGTPTSPFRKKIGILLLLVVIVLWVSSTFLTHAIFSDDSYSKPYFITYLNTCSFSLYLLPWAVRSWWPRRRGIPRGGEYTSIAESSTEEEEEEEEDESADGKIPHPPTNDKDKLDTRETMALSLKFCVLWFLANYLQSSSLKWTSVGSSTILSSTSSIFTLLLAAAMRVERFTWGKFVAVICSLVGVWLVSSVDSTTGPEVVTSGVMVLLGDAMALLGALAYGSYTVLLKARIGHESRVDMSRFFGFVGVFNLLGLWPGLVVLHWAGVERFEVPGDARVWWIVGINALITLVSDYCWVYAMLLTTPLIATVGLSLAIPLALLGQIVVLGLWSGAVYWVGAALVFVAFLFVNWEGGVGGDGGGDGEVVVGSGV